MPRAEKGGGGARVERLRKYLKRILYIDSSIEPISFHFSPLQFFTFPAYKLLRFLSTLLTDFP